MPGVYRLPGVAYRVHREPGHAWSCWRQGLPLPHWIALLLLSKAENLPVLSNWNYAWLEAHSFSMFVGTMKPCRLVSPVGLGFNFTVLSR